MVNDDTIKSSFEISQSEPDLITITFKEPFSDPVGNERQAELVRDQVMGIVNQDQAKTYDLMLDIFQLGGFNYISSGARQIYGNLAKLEQLKKTAVVGNSTFLEIVINLIMQSSGKAANFKWFKAHNKATEWLHLDEDKSEKTP